MLMQVKIDTAAVKANQNEIFSALAHPTRRAVLTRLADRHTPVHLNGLAADLGSARNNGATEQQTKLQIQLYHQHLPKLADAGLIDFDPEQKELCITTTGAEILEEYA